MLLLVSVYVVGFEVITAANMKNGAMLLLVSVYVVRFEVITAVAMKNGAMLLLVSVYVVGFEVITAANVKNDVFWDVVLYGFIINRRFGGSCRLHLQGRNNASK
jgi:hypothetical protein